METSPLFPPSVIASSIHSLLPQGFVLRPLQCCDFEKGFFACLSDLTVVVDVTKDQFKSRFHELLQTQNTYYIIVIEDTARSRIVGSGTIFVERKFIRGLGLAGHIEDIVVLKSYRKLQFGKTIITALQSIAKNVGCYKVILDCAERNVPFYEKCGFQKKEVEMVWYLPGHDPSKKNTGAYPSKL
ncbi:Glucosamine-phosphate N-acetyltransferase-like protein [Coelomomyces lativittatus]|nr:Glucosamine-phosphate N-acetyltransferase-like protein [Coelomomyces lativittatus]KAJ1504044.1 Glucosamine-phosphate N-acetyltransferase-like protein [Coelomomyces lativittatus]KAJ1508025.1 Glucosamine-phosphate N-acetyltransferase-like protein [Coelomomyces lativittatus]